MPSQNPVEFGTKTEVGRAGGRLRRRNVRGVNRRVTTVAGRVAVVAAVWAAVLLLTRVAGAPAEHCPPASMAVLSNGIGEALGWFTRNQNADGSWLFRYDAATARDLGGYDVVHHAGAVSSLWQAAGSGFDSARVPAERGVAFANTHLHDEADWTALYNGTGPLETGSSALYLAGLSLRRATTGDHSLDDEMHRLARFLLAQTEPRGSVLAYREPGGAPLAGVYSPFATGQVFWALALMHREFPSEGWDEPTLRIGTYLATERDGREDDMPDVSDHWAAYGLSAVAAWPSAPDRRPLPDPLVRLTERQSGVLGLQVRWESQRTGGWVNTLVRGGHAIPAGLGSLGEGLAGLWRVAEADERVAFSAGALGERALCAAGMVAARQITPAQATAYAEPSRVQGAWFHDGQTRMDDEQHTLSSMVRSLAIVERARPTRPGATTALPPLVGVLGLLVVANPARTALGFPAGRSRRERVTVGALGGAMASAAIVVLAFVADPLLDALHVSSPTVRLAAALVIAVTGVVDLVGRVPNPEPGLSGLGAAFVPVFVPLVLRPALAILAVSAAADHGVLPVALGAVLVGLGTVGAAVVAPVDAGVRHTVSRWTMALLAAITVALAIAMAIDGVFDV
jgi:small neutral amino acid transporter SnatA (MarC family)